MQAKLPSHSETLFGDDPTLDQIVWAALCGVSDTQAGAALGDVVRKARKQARSVHFLPQYQAQNIITRTLPIGGRFSSRQREMYELVLSALDRSIQNIRPGVEFRQIHLDACRILAEGLKTLGLMKGNIDDAVQCGAHALFFQCGLGHMMGLDVHDMEGLNEAWVGYTDTLKRSDQFGLRSLRLAKALEPGYVLTVEPGIYLIPALIDRWKSERICAEFINYDKVEAYRGFGGIRIEDNVLVTPTGADVLSKEIPRTCQQVEALMGTT